MGAVDGEDNELRVAGFIQAQIPDVNSRLGRNSVPGLTERIVECLEPRLIQRKPVDGVQCYPGGFTLAHSQKVAGEGGAQHGDGHYGNPARKPLKKRAPRDRLSARPLVAFGFHYRSPFQDESTAPRSVMSRSLNGTKCGSPGRAPA